MYYILYKIDNVNKTIYLKIEETIISKNMLSNFGNDYQRIMAYANENNYTIKYIDKELSSYESAFSLKKSL